MTAGGRLAKLIGMRNLQENTPNRLDRMHRSSTPLRCTGVGQLAGLPAALKVSGTVTVLCLAGLVRPDTIAAQSTGTMQVLASVTGAAASWAGLSAAQQIAQEVAATPGAGEARRVDLQLAYIRLEVPAGTTAFGSAPPAISIQYLRN